VLFYPTGSITATRVYGQPDMSSNSANRGGTPNNNTLENPSAVALDSSNNLYIADASNNRVLYFEGTSTTATRVYGQDGSYTTLDDNKGGVSADSLGSPWGLALDGSDNLYISDYSNHRVLYYEAGSTTATRVYGQPDMSSNSANRGGTPNNNTLNYPWGVALDSSNNLYVADYENNRVLYYEGTSTTATRVYGQLGDFTTNIENKGGVSADSLEYPGGLAVDGGNNLYITDYYNSRVLYYPSGSTTATYVYGQGGSFTSSDENKGGAYDNSVKGNSWKPTADGLDDPYSVALDNSGNLYVADHANNRVLKYTTPNAHSACSEAELDAAILAGGAHVFNCDGTITLTGGKTVASELRLEAAPGRNVTIDGVDTYRIFNITAAGDLTIINLTITDGNSPSANGGGVLNAGKLTVTNSTFSSNSTGTGYFGGGINNTGTLVVSYSTFSDNSADYGGGIHNTGIITSISNSTFSDNSAFGLTGYGGGINNGGTITSISNSTFSGNSATTNGGGIDNVGTITTIANSTFSDNSAPDSTGAVIYNNSGTITTIANTIIANSPSGDNCDSVPAGTNNLSDDGTCGFAAGGGSDSDSSINLGALATNSGTTQTHALLAGSTAISAGDSTTCRNTPVNDIDQRGQIRGGCDIGAYAKNLLYVTTAADTNDGSCTPSHCSLREAISTAYSGDFIEFGAGNAISGITITLVSPLPQITTTITIHNDADDVVISGDDQYRVFDIKAAGNLTLDNMVIADGNAGSENGGGIRNAGTLAVSNSTFSNNAALYGGGIYNIGTITRIANSTFSGNSATTAGGGLWNVGGYTIDTIVNSTFSGNSATASGAGIYNAGAITTIANTIVANNTGGNCAVNAPGTSTKNLTDSTGCWSWTDTLVPAEDLGPLADNGGPTPTHALLGTSLTNPAIDASGAGATTSDQRDVSASGTRDIGAYEHEISTGILTVNKTPDTDDGRCTYTDCSLREAISAAGSGATINFSTSGTVSLTSPLPQIATTIQINANLKNVTVSGADTFRVFDITAVGNLSVDKLTIANGYTSGDGGGIRNAGTLTISDSTFSGNSAMNGGGIYNAGGTISIIVNSTFSGNSATGDGSSSGGGIYNGVGGIINNIVNSTFSGNTAVYGGGIDNDATINYITNTIVSGVGDQCDSNPPGTSTNNLADSTGCWSWTDTLVPAEDLGPLVDNGGPTPTHALLGTSASNPAIGTGHPDACDAAPVNALDQRGVTRPQGSGCEIGAYEKDIYIIYLPLILR